MIEHQTAADEAAEQQAFMALTDEFVQMANARSEDLGSVRAGAALLYAAARFNAFVVASRSRDVAEMQTDRAIAIRHFSEQHDKMLRENLDDYEEHFDAYITRYRSA
jgi:hypothetical protein